MNKTKRVNISEGLMAELLAQVNFFCPLCHKSLVEQKGNRSRKRYEIAHIYPHSATEEQKHVLVDVPRAMNIESSDNLIPLCLDCHDKQDFHTTREDYLRLYARKIECARRYQARKIAADSLLEPELKQVIGVLGKDVSSVKVDLTFTPLSVQQKIHENLLREKILSYVTQYFQFLQNEFKKLNTRSFELIASQFKQYFLHIENTEMFQDQIFDQLVEWVQMKTQAKRTACEIIVAFFVQNCEVFREIPE